MPRNRPKNFGISLLQNELEILVCLAVVWLGEFDPVLAGVQPTGTACWYDLYDPLLPAVWLGVRPCCTTSFAAPRTDVA
jgi:hypothetical protein